MRSAISKRDTPEAKSSSPSDARISTYPSSAPGCGPRDVANDRGELLRARPHRPVARRQVDVGHLAQLGQAADPRIALLDSVLDLLRRHLRAHDRGRHVETRVVGQLRSLAQRGTRLGNGAPPERLELLLTKPLEAFVLRELLPRGQRFLDVAEVRLERAGPWARADGDHRREPFRNAAGGRLAGKPAAP